MLRTIILGCLAAVALCVASVSSASAQDKCPPKIPVPDVKLVGTTWDGSEDLWDDGALTFQFSEDGKVVMMDKHATVHGTFTVNGTSVRIEFTNCVYEGRVDANSLMSGTARFTAGDNAGTEWNFSVQR